MTSQSGFHTPWQAAKFFMTRAGMTQAQLSRASGIADSQMSRFFKGRPLGVAGTEKLCDALKLSPDDRGVIRDLMVVARANSRIQKVMGKDATGHLIDNAVFVGSRPATPSPINPVELANCSLRHTFISHLLASGADIRAVMAAVGHTQLETTMRYLSMVRGLADVSLLKF